MIEHLYYGTTNSEKSLLTIGNLVSTTNEIITKARIFKKI